MRLSGTAVAHWARRLRPAGPVRVTRKKLIAALVVLGVVAGAAAGLATLRVDTQPQAFLPAGDPTLRNLEAAARSFGGDPIVVLLESEKPGQLLGREQLPLMFALEGRLSELRDVAVVYGPATVLNQIAIASQQLLATITGKRDGVQRVAEQQAREAGASPAQVRAAGLRAVAQFDERYGPLLVRGLPAGLPTLSNAGFVEQVVYADDGLPRPQWRFVVPAPHAVAILVRPRENLGQAGTDRLVAAVERTVAEAGLRTTRVTVTGVPAVAASLADQVRREIPLVGALAVGLIALCYLVVPWLGRKRHRLLPIAATLAGTALTLAVFGWLGRPLSLGAMAFLPILIGIGSDFPAYLIQGGQRRRVLVAALASAAGFASLAVSPLPFVRDLGLALAMGVLLALAMAFLLRRYLVADPPPPVGSRWEPPRVPSRMTRAGLAGMALLVAGTGWAMLPRLDLQARPDQLAAGLPAVRDVEHAEQILGTSGEVRIVLRGPNVLTPEALDWMRRTQDTVVVEHGSQLRPIVSLPDLLRFLGPSPTGEQIQAAVGLLPRYLVGSVVAPGADEGRHQPGDRAAGPAEPAAPDRGTAVRSSPGTARFPGQRGGLAGGRRARLRADLRRPLPDQHGRHRRRRARAAHRAAPAVGRGPRGGRSGVGHRMGTRRCRRTGHIAESADRGARLADHGYRVRVHGVAVRCVPTAAGRAAAHGGGGGTDRCARLRHPGRVRPGGDPRVRAAAQRHRAALVRCRAPGPAGRAPRAGPSGGAGGRAGGESGGARMKLTDFPWPGELAVRLSATALLPVLLVGLLTAMAHTAAALPDDAAFRVGEAVVTREELEDRVDLLEAMYGIGVPTGGAEVDQFRRTTAKAVAVSILLDNAAAARGITIGEDAVAQVLDGLVQRHGGRAEFVQMLGRVGASEQDVRDEIERRRREARLVQQIGETAPAVTDAQLRQYYDEHSGQIVRPEHRALRNIVVATEERATELLARARDGADFAALAKEYSLDAMTRDSGGSMGAMRRDQLLRPYAEQAFTAAPGTVFGPVRTRAGWNVGKVESVEPATPLSFEQARDQLREQLMEKRRQEAWRGWLGQEMRQAEIEYAPGYRPVDPDVPPSVAAS